MRTLKIHKARLPLRAGGFYTTEKKRDYGYYDTQCGLLIPGRRVHMRWRTVTCLSCVWRPGGA